MKEESELDDDQEYLRRMNGMQYALCRINKSNTFGLVY